MTFSVWLDSAFSTFDSNILSAMHRLALSSSGVFTPLMEFISLFGTKGIFSIALGVLFLLFAKTRKTGVAVLVSVIVSALICNVTLKPLVDRYRPYTKSPFAEWWGIVGAHLESDRSFPSGHVNNITAVLVSIFLFSKNKRYTWPLFLGIPLMCLSRIYLMVHYPTDVIAGAFTGFISAVIGFFITRAIYAIIVKNKHESFCDFFLNFDIMLIFNKKRT